MADTDAPAAPAAPDAQPASLTKATAAPLTGAQADKPVSPYDQVDELKPATEMAASGALIEPTIVDRVPVDHPAVDNNPRAGQSRAANMIEMNDPLEPGSHAVARKVGMPQGEPAKA